LHLIREENMGETELSELLYNQCGLLGLSGISSDMQVLLKSKLTQAHEAVDSFCYSIQQGMGSLITSLEGLDGLVFTGGIGEHAAQIRSKVCLKLHWLGLKLDESLNQQNAALISANDSSIRVWVIPTDEESVIASHSFKLIHQNSNQD